MRLWIGLVTAALVLFGLVRSARAQVELVDGSRVDGRTIGVVPGAYVIVERPDGKREAILWQRVSKIDGQVPPPVPNPGLGTLIPDGFTPAQITHLTEAGKQFSEAAKTAVFAPDGQSAVGSIKSAQDVLERVGAKRGPPNAYLATAPVFGLPFCFEMMRGTLGRADGTGIFGGACRYVLVPMAVAELVLAPFFTDVAGELKGPSVHHLDTSVYAIDYSKKSALTGSYARQPSGGFFNKNLGYDATYTYIHRRIGLLAYGHATLQQTSIASTDYLEVSSSFFKGDAQIGIDLIRLLSGGKKDSYWSQHIAFVRGGPSLFHTWVTSRDMGSPKEGAAVDNPLNNSVALVTGLGYEVAAEVDFRFPLWLGGFHFKFERGTYPSLGFPGLNPRDSAFVALIGFDDLRQGKSYTWQRLKLDLELPINFSRQGGVSLGGQLARYENNFGSGVNNRGISLDYHLRFE